MLQFFVLFVPFVANFFPTPKNLSHKGHKEHKGRKKEEKLSKSNSSLQYGPPWLRPNAAMGDSCDSRWLDRNFESGGFEIAVARD